MDESRQTDDTAFIERELSINAIVSHRTIHNIVVMNEIPLRTISTLESTYFL